MDIRQTIVREQGSIQSRTLKSWQWMARCISTLFLSSIVTGLCAIHVSNSQKCQKSESTIDSILQAKMDSILRCQMYNIHALSGQAIIMKVATGEIRSLVGLRLGPDGDYEAHNNFGLQQESGLVRIASALALLDENKASLDTKVSTGMGAYEYNGRWIFDQSYYNGGLGEITLKQVLQYSSNVGIAKFVTDAYDKRPQSFFNKLDEMSFGKPDALSEIPELNPVQYTSPKNHHWKDFTLAFSAFGYERKIAPLQLLTFFNAIANNGKMVMPQLFVGHPVVINPQIADKKHIREMQNALQYIVEEGAGKKASSPIVKVAGCSGITQVRRMTNERNENIEFEYHVEFCGYFPIQHPEYCIIVSMNKNGKPASGAMHAAPVFKQIVEYMMQRNEGRCRKGQER